MNDHGHIVNNMNIAGGLIGRFRPRVTLEHRRRLIRISVHNLQRID